MTVQSPSYVAWDDRGTDGPPAEVDQAIEAALRKIYDPCSVAAGTSIDIVDMGLVRGWRLEDHHLEVDYCVTAVSCRLAPSFIKAAEGELLQIETVEEVSSKIDATFTWTEDQLAASARERLEVSRTALRQQVRPQQWRTASSERDE